jgi:hypothetical protein
MSEEKSSAGSNPIVSFDDAVDFLSKRTDRPCPACGHYSWNVSAGSEVEGDIVVASFALANQANGSIFFKGLPLVVATCKKCAFMRVHNLRSISRWIKEGKPEFVDEAD